MINIKKLEYRRVKQSERTLTPFQRLVADSRTEAWLGLDRHA